MAGNSPDDDRRTVVPLRPAGGGHVTDRGAGRHPGGERLAVEPAAGLAAELEEAAARALAEFERHLDRAALSAHTVRAYRRGCRAFTAWLAEHAPDHPDAFADVVGADAAVKAWRRSLLEARASVATVNQARAAVGLLYELAGLRLTVKPLRVPPPGEPDALTDRQAGAVERAAKRRGARDAAIVAVLLYSGARVEECARLQVEDVPVTARTGDVRLHGKGDQVRTVPLPAPARAALLDGSPSAAAPTGRCGPDSADPSPSPASPRWCSRSATRPGSRGCGRTPSGTPTPPGCAAAAPTPPRCSTCSGTPPWPPAAATSAPAPPRSRAWSSTSSASDAAGMWCAG
ncbi:hypothetical protein GCM10009727_89030 [Actinomadura napierensis]|uniref:Tyrosine-type recombinase/integrase n=1 Tax=Actinomadura napierensis TaxID=267854 RepID=A0ABN3AGT1_9ACTN